MEEVATMKLNTILRPSLPLTAACAPSASPALVAAERAPVMRAHQVPFQAELGWTNGSAYASNGTTGFVGANSVAIKQMVDDASGVPPRGRPV